MTADLTPAQLAQRMLGTLSSDSAALEELLAPDVVVETPFAPAGRPRRVEGRNAFVKMAREGRRDLPVRFDGARNVVVHETTDPAVVVVEYELSGTVTTTGRTAAAPFIAVLTARAGQITGWREYQDTAAIAAALGS